MTQLFRAYHRPMALWAFKFDVGHNSKDLFTFCYCGTIVAVILAADLLDPKTTNFLFIHTSAERAQIGRGSVHWIKGLRGPSGSVHRVRAPMFREKIEVEKVMAGMTAAERRQFLDSLFIYVAAAIDVYRRADQQGVPPPSAPDRLWEN